MWLCALGVFMLLVVYSAAPVAAAPEWDPAPAIAAYTAAVNAHDVPAAVALFDQYGSASDMRGRHYEGQAGLTEFLVATGFASPDAEIQTVGVHIVGNRAVWTYLCSCQKGPTEVRMVMKGNKISVFAIMPPAAVPYRRVTNDVPMAVWAALAGALVLGVAVFVQRHIPTVRRRRVAQGQLIASLARARGR